MAVSAAEASVLLERSERQVQRYLAEGRHRGSRASGRWLVTALHIWEFQGIADEMLDSWRAYCRLVEAEDINSLNQQVNPDGE